MSFTAQLNAALRIMLTGKSKSEMPEAIRAMDADIRANSGNAAIAATRGATEGIALPLAQLLQLNRDYNVGTPEKGGLVTESVLRGDLLLEALYPKNVLTDLGVQIWTLDSAIEIPRQSAVTGVVYGYGEKAVATGHDEYEFSMLNLKPHRIAAYQGVTNQMILQQSFDIVGLMTPYNLMAHGDAEPQQIAAWLKENYIDKGYLGVATGRGFYSYGQN